MKDGDKASHPDGQIKTTDNIDPDVTHMDQYN